MEAWNNRNAIPDVVTCSEISLRGLYADSPALGKSKTTNKQTDKNTAF